MVTKFKRVLTGQWKPPAGWSADFGRWHGCGRTAHRAGIVTSSVSGVASRRRSTERSKRRQGGVSAGLLAEQHQALIDNLGCKKRGHIPHIVRRADRVHVDRNDVETDKAAQKLDALARRQATPARRRPGLPFRVGSPIPTNGAGAFPPAADWRNARSDPTAGSTASACSRASQAMSRWSAGWSGLCAGGFVTSTPNAGCRARRRE